MLLHKTTVHSVFKPETFVGECVYNKNVENQNVAKNVNTHISSLHSGRDHSGGVFTRVFYNSAYDRRTVQGLLARGNKIKVLSANFTHTEAIHHEKLVTKSTIRGGYSGLPAADVSHKLKVTKSITSTGRGSVNCVQRSTDVGQNTPGVQKYITPQSYKAPWQCTVYKDVSSIKKCDNHSKTSHKVRGSDVPRCEVKNNIGQVSVDKKCQVCQTVSKDVSGQPIVSGGFEKCEKSNDTDTRCESFQGCEDMVEHTVPLFDIRCANSDDKFVNTLFTKKKISTLVNSKVQQLLNKWSDQSDFCFGFVPLSEFVLLDPTVTDGETIVCPIEMHRRIKHSACPNFLHCRFPVESQLNIPVWKEALVDYWDNQLIHLLEYGFPLDFNQDCKLYCEHKNHSSANDHPEHIDAYLQEERQFGAILGPFKTNPIPDCHSSPFMTREKSHSAKRRVIIDLSWPKHASVNAGVDKDSYLGTDFALTFPTVDDITQEIKLLGKGCHLFKVDISRAFRHIKINPRDYDLLGLEWGNASFIDTCLPFGNRHGTQIFQRVSDTVRYVMRQKGVRIINYVNDFVGVATPDVARRSFDALRAVLDEFGLDISPSKLVYPDTSAVCLGVNINTADATIAIPDDKLRQIVDVVNDWEAKNYCSKRQLQSLLGHLLYVHKCVKPSRIFLHRMLELLRKNYDKNSITLTHEFKRDLRWFQRFLATYNGVSFFHHRVADGILQLDACMTGLGGTWGRFVYHLPLENHLKNLGIVHLEMINILVALRIFAPSWHQKAILVRCDNNAVVQVLTSGKTRDPFLATCARNIWMTAALADIELQYKHIRGCENTAADLLSRWRFTGDQYAKLCTLVHEPIWMQTNASLLDLDYLI